MPASARRLTDPRTRFQGDDSFFAAENEQPKLRIYSCSVAIHLFNAWRRRDLNWRTRRTQQHRFQRLPRLGLNWVSEDHRIIEGDSWWALQL
jgi:hypothetical protein